MVQPAKKLDWDLWHGLEAVPGRLDAVPATAFADDVAFFGPAPIAEVNGRDALIETVYAPLARAFPKAHRRPYLFLGGHFKGARWVATTGDIVGTMRQDWLGIPATGKTMRLRFGEFYRLNGDKLHEN